MKVINLFGEPCSGKSTISAGLFYYMKIRNYNVELVTEYAKDLVWEQRDETFKDQLYITAKQNHRLECLRNKVDYVITDSLILLGAIYANYNIKYRNSLLLIVIEQIFKSYDNINFLLNRKLPYKNKGRIHNENQSIYIKEEIIKTLHNNFINYITIDSDETSVHKILSKLN